MLIIITYDMYTGGLGCPGIHYTIQIIVTWKVLVGHIFPILWKTIYLFYLLSLIEFPKQYWYKPTLIK